MFFTEFSNEKKVCKYRKARTSKKPFRSKHIFISYSSSDYMLVGKPEFNWAKAQNKLLLPWCGHSHMNVCCVRKHSSAIHEILLQMELLVHINIHKFIFIHINSFWVSPMIGCKSMAGTQGPSFQSWKNFYSFLSLYWGRISLLALPIWFLSEVLV